MTESLRRPTGALFLAIFCLVAGCSTPDDAGQRSVDTKRVTGVTWEWTGTKVPDRQIDVSRPDRYTIRLKQDGEARIRYDCNHGGAMFEIAEGKLSFGPLTFTRIKCGEGSQSISYRQQLTLVESFFTRDGDLYLNLPRASATMRFRKAD